MEEINGNHNDFQDDKQARTDTDPLFAPFPLYVIINKPSSYPNFVYYRKKSLNKGIALNRN